PNKSRGLQDVAITFEDLRVQAGVAVVLLRDLAQRLALLNDVPLGCVPLVGSTTLLRLVLHRLLLVPVAASPCHARGLAPEPILASRRRSKYPTATPTPSAIVKVVNQSITRHIERRARACNGPLVLEFSPDAWSIEETANAVRGLIDVVSFYDARFALGSRLSRSSTSSRSGERSSAPGSAHVAGVAERVAPGLRPHREAVRLLADGNGHHFAGRRVDHVHDVVVAPGEPQTLAVHADVAHVGAAALGARPRR